MARREILFIGTEQGIEYRVLPKEGFKLETLTVKGLKGRGIRGIVDALYGVPAGLLRSLAIMRAFRPDCVIGLGGYASGPGVAGGQAQTYSLRDHGAESAAGFHQSSCSPVGSIGFLPPTARASLIFPARGWSKPAIRCAGRSCRRLQARRQIHAADFRRQRRRAADQLCRGRRIETTRRS